MHNSTQNFFHFFAFLFFAWDAPGVNCFHHQSEHTPLTLGMFGITLSCKKEVTYSHFGDSHVMNSLWDGLLLADRALQTHPTQPGTSMPVLGSTVAHAPSQPIGTLFTCSGRTRLHWTKLIPHSALNPNRNKVLSLSSLLAQRSELWKNGKISPDEGKALLIA